MNKSTPRVRPNLVSMAASYGLSVTDFFVRMLSSFAWPKVELLIRFWLAKSFFMSGVMKLTHWPTTIQLAAHDPGFMSPLTAAYLGVSIETIGAALLVIGLMTRYASLALLVLTLIIPRESLDADGRLFWCALLAWFAIVGAGIISLDSLFRRGLASSALPGASRLLAWSNQLRVLGAPWYLLLLRLWISLALLVASLPELAQFLPLATLATELPATTVAILPRATALAAGCLLFAGLGTRYIAALLMLMLSVDAMMAVRMTDGVYLLMLFSTFVIYGGGKLSVDQLLRRISSMLIQKRHARDPQALQGLPRIVIVGAGFGGVSCATRLRGIQASITLIDRENYHLFQPLLYQVATAGLSPADIAAPVRSVFRESFETQVLLGEVTRIDTDERVVSTANHAITYDYLVLATGATHSYFGSDEWAPHAPGLKSIEDALEIRRRILTAFEEAESASDERARRSLLTFLIVGGGPTGVELAGAIAELARYGMDKEFRTFDPASARILLVQAGSRLLPTFSESLSRIAQQSLEKLGVEVLLNSRVEAIDAEGVGVNGARVESRTVLWAAGVTASPAASWLGANADRANRLIVGPDLAVPGLTNVFAIGDTAASLGWKGQPVPGLAAAAKQGGSYVANLIRARIEGRVDTLPFRYRHLGSLATIGRKAAVADFGFAKLWGAPAWWLWGAVHVSFLVGLRSRVATLVNWFWAYLKFGSGIRLITGGAPRGVLPRHREVPARAVSAPATLSLESERH